MLQLQLKLHYTTLHPAVVGEVTTATIATTPENTTPTTFRSISGFALPLWFTTTNLSCRFAIFETSATASCGTTGKGQRSTVIFWTTLDPGAANPWGGSHSSTSVVERCWKYILCISFCCGFWMFPGHWFEQLPMRTRHFYEPSGPGDLGC